jgi:predicted HicB family RNase H-like nuclease
MKNINIQIEDSLHLAVKQKALTSKVSLKQYVTLALQEKLNQEPLNTVNSDSIEQEDIQ